MKILISQPKKLQRKPTVPTATKAAFSNVKKKMKGCRGGTKEHVLKEASLEARLSSREVILHTTEKLSFSREEETWNVSWLRGAASWRAPLPTAPRDAPEGGGGNAKTRTFLPRIAQTRISAIVFQEAGDLKVAPYRRRSEGGRKTARPRKRRTASQKHVQRAEARSMLQRLFDRIHALLLETDDRREGSKEPSKMAFVASPAAARKDIGTLISTFVSSYLHF